MIQDMTKNTDKLVCIQYDISLRLSDLANAIPRDAIRAFQPFSGCFSVFGQVM